MNNVPSAPNGGGEPAEADRSTRLARVEAQADRIVQKLERLLADPAAVARLRARLAD